MDWRVLRFDFNSKRIFFYNIFDHAGFRKDVDALLTAKYLSREEFEESIQSSLRYYFWSRAEYEVLVRAWVGSNGDEEIKIDIYQQVAANLPQFLDYVWSYRHDE